MKVGFVLAGHYPNDARVEREARLLRRLGHEVHVLCVRLDGQPHEEVVEGVTIHRVDAAKSRMVYLVHRIIYMLFFLELFWMRRMDKFVKTHGVHLLHVQHSLALVPAALLVGRIRGRPVVFDMHDSQPDAMRAWALEASWSERLFLGVRRMRWLEKMCSRWVDELVVANDYRALIHEEYGISCEKPVLLINVPDVDWLRAQPIDPTITASFESFFMIFYYGSFGFNRGLDTAIRAMPLVLENVPNALLVLAGPPNPATELPQTEMLRELVDQMMLSKAVKFTGSLAETEIATYLALCEIGILPLKMNPHYERSLANKLFAYAAFGKPIIASDLRAQSRFIREERCGLLVPPEDPQALASAIIQMHGDPDLAKAMGLRGQSAVQDRYNLQAASGDFIAMYNRLERRVAETALSDSPA